MKTTLMKNVFNEKIHEKDLTWDDLKRFAEDAPTMKEKGFNAIICGHCTWHYEDTVNKNTGEVSKAARGRKTHDRWVAMIDADFPRDRLLDDACDYFFNNFNHEVQWGYYSSFSATYDNERYRILINLNRTVTPEEYEIITQAIMHDLDDTSFDPVSSRANQPMFLPCKPLRYNEDLDRWYEEYYSYGFIDGEPLDVDYFLEYIENNQSYYDEFTPVYRDKDGGTAEKKLYKRAEGPLDEDKIYTSGKTEDPRYKDSIVGTFTSLFNPADVIKRWLGGIYESVGSRYRLIGSKNAAGGEIIDDDLYFITYHSDDKAYGAVRNSFDLIKVWLDDILSLSDLTVLETKYATRRNKARAKYIDDEEFNKVYPEEPTIDKLMYEWAMNIPEVYDAEIKRIQQKHMKE